MSWPNRVRGNSPAIPGDPPRDSRPIFRGGFSRGRGRGGGVRRRTYNYTVDLSRNDYMIDIGSNLTSKKFDNEIDGIIDRAYHKKVKMQIITGSDLKNSKEAYDLTNNFKYGDILRSTVGIHPHYANTFNKKTYDIFREMLQNDFENKIVAVGETGLDYYRMISPKDQQISSFKEHIKLAIEFNKPLFLHERDAHHDFLKILDEFKGKLPPVVVHCFTGKGKELEAYVQRGFYIGITGFIAIEHRSQTTQKCIKKLPLDKLMIETDAPYMKPTNSPETPTKCMEPSLLYLVALKLAKLYGVKPEVITEHTTRNTKKFFGLDKKPENTTHYDPLNPSPLNSVQDWHAATSDWNK